MGLYSSCCPAAELNQTDDRLLLLPPKRLKRRMHAVRAILDILKQGQIAIAFDFAHHLHPLIPMKSKVFDWGFAFTHVIPNHKKSFTSVLQKNEELRRLIAELKETKGKFSRLDWSVYSNAAISMPSMKKENLPEFVRSLQESISSFSPRVDISTEKEFGLIEIERTALVLFSFHLSHRCLD